MASYNKTILLGNLTRAPELKTLPSGTPACTLGIATNHSYTDKSGEKREEVCFIDCEAFGKTAETISKYFEKGEPILIEGRLRYRTWETDDGKRSKHDILIDRFTFVGSKRDQEGTSNIASETPIEPSYQAGVPESKDTSEDVPF